MMSGKLSDLVKVRQRHEDLAKDDSNEVDPDDYEMYEPFLVGLKPHMRMAGVFNIIFLSRRIIFISMLFILTDMKWLVF